MLRVENVTIMKDEIYSIVLGYTSSIAEANDLTNELCVLLGVSKPFDDSIEADPKSTNQDVRFEFVDSEKRCEACTKALTDKELFDGRCECSHVC